LSVAPGGRARPYRDRSPPAPVVSPASCRPGAHAAPPTSSLSLGDLRPRPSPLRPCSFSRRAASPASVLPPVEPPVSAVNRRAPLRLKTPTAPSHFPAAYCPGLDSGEPPPAPESSSHRRVAAFTGEEHHCASVSYFRCGWSCATPSFTSPPPCRTPPRPPPPPQPSPPSRTPDAAGEPSPHRGDPLSRASRAAFGVAAHWPCFVDRVGQVPGAVRAPASRRRARRAETPRPHSVRALRAPRWLGRSRPLRGPA
jgi:hypothetical protein